MIEINQLNLELPGFSLQNINLKINKGEFFTILGPTGSGKTLLLETIAGLKKPDQGSIRLNGQDVTALKPEQRNISIVYQDYALFPNMSVQQNIKFGLRFKNKGMPNQEKFEFLVKMLGIDNILKRYPQNLSGGEKQRVALARALIVNPDILLLDEPFSALDVNTKETIQKEIKILHHTFKTTTLMVTHNFNEVFSLAEKVAIVKDGAIQQVGLTKEVFKMPNSKFVAHFVGMKNIFPILKDNNRLLLEDLLSIDIHELPEAERNLLKHKPGGTDYFIGFRPEDIVVGNNRLLTEYQFNGIISEVSNNGILTEVKIKTSNLAFITYLTPNRYFELELCENKYIYFGFNKKDINFIIGGQA